MQKYNALFGILMYLLTGPDPLKLTLSNSLAARLEAHSTFSNSMASYLVTNGEVSNQGSTGSTENLRKLNRGGTFGVVHSGISF